VKKLISISFHKISAYMHYIMPGLSLLYLISCQGNNNTYSGKPILLTSTSMLEEGLRFIAGDSFEVISLMGSGVDPHVFRPSAQDLELLRKAEIIIYNGLLLEGRMGEILSIVGKDKPVWAISDGISEDKFLVSDARTGIYDPHIWMDPVLWSEGMLALSNRLGEWIPEKKEAFAEKGKKYRDSLLRLDTSIREGLNKVPEENRILVTSHDAFRYFGRAYQWEVIGLQGISTAGDIGLKEISNLTELLVQRKIPVVFPEASVSSRNLEAVRNGCMSRGHTVREGPVLYTDAPGDKDSPEGTYSGMLLYNQEVLTQWIQP